MSESTDEIVPNRYTDKGDEELFIGGEWVLHRIGAREDDRKWGAVNLLVTGALMSVRLSASELARERDRARNDLTLEVPIDEVAARIDDSVRGLAIKQLQKMAISGKISRDELPQALQFARTAT